MKKRKKVFLNRKYGSSVKRDPGSFFEGKFRCNLSPPKKNLDHFSPKTVCFPIPYVKAPITSKRISLFTSKRIFLFAAGIVPFLGEGNPKLL